MSSNSNTTNSQDITTPTTLYGYIPTLWVCITFIILFGITTIIHLTQALFMRPRFYWIIPTFVACGIGEVIGWSGRLWSHINSENQTPYLMQFITTVFAPVFLTAALYNVVALIIPAIGEEYSRIKPKTYVKIFVALDVICLFVQVAGGVIASSSDSDSAGKLGTDVFLVGIILQLITLSFFTVLAVEVIHRYRTKKPLRARLPSGYTLPSSSSDVTIPFIGEKLGSPDLEKRINRMTLGLVIATSLVFIRSFYRIAELADGFHGVIIRTQAYFTLFDATPIVLALFTMNIFSPSLLL